MMARLEFKKILQIQLKLNNKNYFYLKFLIICN